MNLNGKKLLGVTAILPVLVFGIWAIDSSRTDETVPETAFAGADRLVEAGIADSLFPGAVLLVGNREAILHHRAYGHASVYDRSGSRLSEPEPMTTRHLFDLASLTKIFATTYALMHLHSRGKADLDEPVYRILPQFDAAGKRDITIRHLLTHSSGLMQWYPTYYVSDNPAERLEFLAARKPDGRAGEARRYSDPGFMILGDLVAEICGEPLDACLRKNIYEPMGLESTLFNPDGRSHPHIVSTSRGNPFEKRMVHDDDFGYRVDVDPLSWDGWRTHYLRGEVNDGNSFHTHDGIAGHAGLFSTAEEIWRLLLPVLGNGNSGQPDPGIFAPPTVDLFFTRDRFGSAPGWMTGRQILSGPQLPENRFGHTGFTGTHFVVFPENDLILVLLTNRQHFGVDSQGYYPDLGELRNGLAREILGTFARE